MSLRPPAIETAELDWNDHGGPVSRRHGDVYFSVEDGLAETRYVFLAANRLAERFATLGSGPNHLTIAETGFGTGLNFLAAWDCWRQHAPQTHSVLHYISFERYPLTREDLRRALSAWPTLEEFADALVAQYPPPVRGAHRLVFDEGRVRLTLFQGDALEGLEKLNFFADAWFLDGFAPACNPDLWADGLLSEVARHSRAGTTFSTFTAAGHVRRALAGVGFQVEKVPGFGRKREMLRGTNGAPAPQKPETLTHVTLIGAGMAGSLLAANLASRGIRVTVIDHSPAPATGASGNAQGALYVKLGVDCNAQTRLAMHGLLHSQRTFDSPYFGAPEIRPFWHRCGLLQLASTAAEQQRQQSFIARNDYPSSLVEAVSAAEASEKAKLDIGYPGLWFPANGWVSPPILCHYCLEHPLIDFIGEANVDGLSFREGGGWQITMQGKVTRDADVVVLCAGIALSALIPETYKPIRVKPIRGQITALPAQQLTGPQCVVCADGYVNPSDGERILIGATFDLHDSTPSVLDSSRQENLKRISAWLPGLHPDLVSLSGDTADRVSFRATTTDYQPLAGPLSRNPSSTEQHTTEQSLFCFGGLGSKGLALAPLLAEWLADRLSRQPECLESDLIKRILPSRFH
ncbi:bifunctional tRNA (5-methylaminomethyl-2-thiouridine)(34)-methyltransferase MnmD/FAD-dependent 5-carboxymethylaminomethyl-2-thiouridine(34) oxidoreductase MnmC [Mangrovitalea sediminis]|uniref:bifunctional tRNA (5-methylaminomethyl-2-thiouridine)(34)-methyltransferase MnmD/FAD-dependent 5-carboxymethylaminomethyl-2-thiouridine(34) oxidoreductase MnmC n=1 Tax=Mangrovitalea sediminis TaxID=1982043 RepID=UPI000BE5F55C|nr:bifunctional tRNA (5-methylaminomethyl-2-thiouridine)(34)-methyltransferase MnmD/FAD-dependent 5-carboxymethylaminomethyl-2-thiouridine(34) oxidoreductase MnmC [Mangrovitalea sediminis]